ncbi:MAG: GspH/FimT family pseudopilin [Geminicoccales bacterium]
MDPQGHRRGFTLLELLVVLAIIAFVVALVPGYMLRSQPRLDVNVAARAIADGLRRTRGEAILRNRSQVFALDVEDRLFRPGEGTPVQIDRTLELSFLTARSELQSESIGQIRFYPDGSSTGGRISVAQGGWQADVRNDWLTGLVWVDEAAP